MRLLLVRHGQTVENLNKILQGGRIQGSLSQKGIDDTNKLSLRLKEEYNNIDVAFCSDLKRTKETLEIIKIKNLIPKIYLNSDLREQDFGDWTGKKYDEVDFEVKPNNQESLEDVQKRFLNFIESIFSRYAGKTVLIVAHHGVIGSLFCKIEGKSPEHSFFIKQSNTALNVVDMKGSNSFEVVLFNSITHLE